MSYVYENATVRILDWLHLAERDLIGSTITTFGNETGIVRSVKLDEYHGLCFTMNRAFHRRRWYPVSTIKIKGPKP